MDKSLVTGIMFILIGSAFFTASFSYDAGTVTSMGPAFFPRTTSIILIVLGFFIALKNDR